MSGIGGWINVRSLWGYDGRRDLVLWVGMGGRWIFGMLTWTRRGLVSIRWPGSGRVRSPEAMIRPWRL